LVPSKGSSEFVSTKFFYVVVLPVWYHFLTSALVGRSLRLGGLLKPNKRSVFVDKVEVRTFIQKFPVV
jgi:hypothetical protein